MSRTYRRKNELRQDAWVFTRWGWANDCLCRSEVDPKSKYGKILAARYHSDSQMTMGQVPKWYKEAFCRRPFRRKTKEALYNAVKYVDEDHVFPVIKKDALYYW